MARRRAALSSEAFIGLGVSFALLVLITGIEISDILEPSVVGWLTVVPFLAAAFAPWRYVVLVGLASCLATAATISLQPSGLDRTGVALMAGIVVATVGASMVSGLRQRQESRYAELARLASLAQEAVLAPIPPELGRFRIANRYVSASEVADIGGDLYEALDTAYGVRLLIGDVKGKGMDAVRLASLVLGAYRHVAHEYLDPSEIVADLDRAVARTVCDEDFVTAVLLEERGGTLTVINCGHPPPLLLRQGKVIPMETERPALPLGLGTKPPPRVERLEPGDRLLLYTDGLAEARRAGSFFPVTERAWALLGHGTVEDGLASLGSALIEWVRGQFDDDIALLLLEYTGAAPRGDAMRPSWEIGDVSRPRASCGRSPEGEPFAARSERPVRSAT